mgnify:FL=1
MKLSGPIRIVVISGAVALLVTAAYVFAVITVQKLQVSVAASREKAQAEEMQAAASGERVRFAQSLATEEAELSIRFVDGTDLVSFLASIEALGLQTGTVVRIDSVGEEALVSPEERERQEKAGTLQNEVTGLALSLSIEGEWEALMRATRLLETMPYGVRIVQYHIEAVLDEPNHFQALVRMVFLARNLSAQ